MRKGFSLIEIAIVVAVLGILLVLGIPQYNRYNASMELKNTAQLLQDTIEFARVEAQKISSDVLVWNQNAALRPLTGARSIEVAQYLGVNSSSVLRTLTLPANVTCSTSGLSSTGYLLVHGNETITDGAITVTTAIVRLTNSSINTSYNVTIQGNGSVVTTKQ